MSEWNELTLQQQCVMVSALEETDLSALLYDWNPRWAEDGGVNDIPLLTEAITELDKHSLIEVSLSGDGSQPALHRSDLADVLHNRGAWVAEGNDGLEIVAWLSTTPAGDALVATANAEAFSAYRSRPGR